MTSRRPLHPSLRPQGRSPRPAGGAVAIEMAVLFTLLLTIGLAVFDLGRAVYDYDAVAKSARDAARHLSQFAPGDTTRRTEAGCLVRYGNAGCTGAVLSPGLADATVAICDASSCTNTHRNQSTGRGIVNLVTVTVGNMRTSTLASVLFGPSIGFGTISVTMTQVVP